jgi:cell division protein FtsA
MDEPIIVGIDIGTTKICTLVGRIEQEGVLRILGVGIEPSHGMRKGVPVDVRAVTQAVSRSIEKAERTSGMEITSALVSLAGSQVSSVNSKGVVGVSGRTIDDDDVIRSMEAARAVAIPHNREIIHVIQRGFTVDGQPGIRMPLGMHGYRLEVETHIITVAASAVENLRNCVEEAGAIPSQFVLNPLASAEVVLSETEREMGVVVCDVGGGTTDIAIFIEGDVYHTMVLGVGGDHITADIAHGLRLPISQAEEIKIQHGHAVESEVGENEEFHVRPFGEETPLQIRRRELALIVEARVEEIFSLVLQSSIPGIRTIGSQVLGLPVRNAQPDNLVGMTDQLYSPAYSTSVGLLKWSMLMTEIGGESSQPKTSSRGGGFDWEYIKSLVRRLFP